MLSSPTNKYQVNHQKKNRYQAGKQPDFSNIDYDQTSHVHTKRNNTSIPILKKEKRK